jgi:hypothetical protein
MLSQIKVLNAAKGKTPYKTAGEIDTRIQSVLIFSRSLLFTYTIAERSAQATGQADRIRKHEDLRREACPR